MRSEQKILRSFASLSGRVGILGGTFDPVQKAHLAIARELRDRLKLDAVVFIPAQQNPLKTNTPRASADNRVEMLELALKDEPSFFISRFEVDLPQGEPSYTVNTLRGISTERTKGTKLFLLIGSDNLPSLHKWKEVDSIFSLTDGVVPIARSKDADKDLDSLSEHLRGQQVRDLKENLVRITPIEISSTEVRERLARGEAPDELLDPAVLSYIREHKLYGLR